MCQCCVQGFGKSIFCGPTSSVSILVLVRIMMMQLSATGLQSFKVLTLLLCLGTGMTVGDLRQVETVAWDRDKLKMSCK